MSRLQTKKNQSKEIVLNAFLIGAIVSVDMDSEMIVMKVACYIALGLGCLAFTPKTIRSTTLKPCALATALLAFATFGNVFLWDLYNIQSQVVVTNTNVKSFTTFPALPYKLEIAPEWMSIDAWLRNLTAISVFWLGTLAAQPAIELKFQRYKPFLIKTVLGVVVVLCALSVAIYDRPLTCQPCSSDSLTRDLTRVALHLDTPNELALVILVTYLIFFLPRSLSNQYIMITAIVFWVTLALTKSQFALFPATYSTLILMCYLLKFKISKTQKILISALGLLLFIYITHRDHSLGALDLDQPSLFYYTKDVYSDYIANLFPLGSSIFWINSGYLWPHSAPMSLILSYGIFSIPLLITNLYSISIWVSKIKCVNEQVMCTSIIFSLFLNLDLYFSMVAWALIGFAFAKTFSSKFE